MSSRRMWSNSWAFLLLLTATLAGCGPVGSLFPLFTSDDNVFDERLVGQWRMQEGPEYKPGEKAQLIVFRRGRDGNSYDVTLVHFDEQEFDAVTTGRLVRFGDHLFIDFGCPVSGERKLNRMPFPILQSHLFGRLHVEGRSMRIDLLGEGWLSEQIKNGTSSPAYVEIPGGSILSAPTEELRKFALEHAEDNGVFSEAYSLSRLK